MCVAMGHGAWNMGIECPECTRSWYIYMCVLRSNVLHTQRIQNILNVHDVLSYWLYIKYISHQEALSGKGQECTTEHIRQCRSNINVIIFAISHDMYIRCTYVCTCICDDI